MRAASLRASFMGALLMVSAPPSFADVTHDNTPSVRADNHTENFAHELLLSEQKPSQKATLGAENWSRPLEPGWWEWGIRIKGVAAVLDRIRCVEYTLHRSFPNAVRVVCTRQNNFELKTSGSVLSPSRSRCFSRTRRPCNSVTS